MERPFKTTSQYRRNKHIPIPPINETDDVQIYKDKIMNSATSALKTRKSPGYDAIAAEVLKVGDEKMIDNILKTVLKDESISSVKADASKSTRKGDRHGTGNYRAIALLLLLIPGQVYISIRHKKIREKTEELSSESRFGFHQNRGTIDDIFVVPQVLQKAKERGVKPHFHLKDTFHTVWRQSVWQILRAIGIRCNIVNVIAKKMYKNVQ